MQTDPIIIRKNVELAESILDQIRERIAKMEQFFDRIVGCRVAVEGPSPHHRAGKHQIRIVVGVPGNDIVISHHTADQLEIAIRDAFNAADRKLEDYVRALRGDVKTKPWRRKRA